VCVSPHLYWGFARDVGNQEVHGDIFTVHVCVHPILDVSRHLVRVQIVEVLGLGRRDHGTISTRYHLEGDYVNWCDIHTNKNKAIIQTVSPTFDLL
jgi:hypothetical protein